MDLLKKTDYNAKITKIKSKIPIISGLATTSALTAVENKIPDLNRFTKNIVVNKIKSEGLVNQSDIAGFIDNADLDKSRTR